MEATEMPVHTVTYLKSLVINIFIKDSFYYIFTI